MASTEYTSLPSPYVPDDSSLDERRDHLWQDDHPEQELLPLRETPPSSGPSKGPPLSRKKPVDAGELRKHVLGLWLIILYALIAILSWTITCVLCYQPIGIPTYFDQVGNYSRSRYESSERWRVAATLGTSVVGAISIPVTSAICAKAAAVYCQRRSDVKAPPITLRQMLALEDKGWSDSAVIRDVLRPSTSRQTRSPLLMFAAVLVVIAFFIPILQGALVSTIYISILSLDDQEFTPVPIGQQITPGILAASSNTSVMDSIISATINGMLTDKQPFLWSTDQKNLSVNSLVPSVNIDPSFDNLADELFFSTFPIGTDGGVYRNLALRLNVSVSCASVAQSDFPSSCTGTEPLNRTYSNINSSDPAPFGDLNNPRYRARICAPGNILTSPWQFVSSRQDIHEEFWLDFQRTTQGPGGGVWGYEDRGSNYTLHCSSNSTLGFFELPNYWNGHVAGPLLDTVPLNGPNLSYQNSDNNQLSAGSRIPIDGVPGPFLAATLAVFGPRTFFDTVASSNAYTNANQIACSTLRYPFTGLSVIGNDYKLASWNQTSPMLDCPSHDFSDDPVSPLLAALLGWLPNFGDPTQATAALTLATYAASNAILNVGPSQQNLEVWACAGSDLQKPTMAVATMVVVTLLLAAQLVGLAFLAVYASRRPSWTESLDAWAILRIGAEIGPDVPAVSAAKAQRAKMLDEKKGWIGDAGTEWREAGGEYRELRLGGMDGVREGALYRTVRAVGVP
ncbi:hypothetical protein MMC17_010189 [Xylographa soralifera]|nr:hypothetical protein [Xylographa soralifera]